MTKDEHIASFKYSVLQHARKHNNITYTCKVFCLSRTVYYKWLERFSKLGYLGLQDKEKAKPRMPNQIKPDKEKIILNYVIEYLTHGPRRIANELRQQDVTISETGIYHVLCRKQLNHRLDRLFYAQEKSDNPVVTEKYFREIEKRKENHIHAYYPGYLFCQDTFYVGSIKDLGRIYQQTGIDAYSNFGFAKVPKPFQKEIKYFWGYRNFVLSDALSELPILEETKPANIVDSKVIIPQLELAKDRFDLNIRAVIADAGLDSEKVLSFIINDLKAKPYIARNLRREKDLKVSSTGNRICLAGFEMLYWGKYKEGNRTRVKFVCPIIHSKKFRKEHPFCPWMHPQFVKGTGCFAYTQVLSEDIRKQIAYGTPKFKKIYNLRSGCERIFSRLLDLCMQNPSVRGLRAISNHCTIAHITVLLIALTAARTGNKDKIRFVKSFLPNI